MLKRFSRETGNRPPDVASHSLHVYFGGLLVVGWIRRGHFLSIRVICGGLELTILLLETFLSGRTRIALPELLAAALADYRELFVRVKFLEIALRAVDVHNLIGEELIDFMYVSPEYDTLSQQKSHGSLPDHGGAPIFIDHVFIIEKCLKLLFEMRNILAERLVWLRPGWVVRQLALRLSTLVT